MTEILIFLTGISLGSFMNVIAHRLPKNEDFLFSRSKCPQCFFTLHWFDLIPILSFIWLRGSCRNCHTKISLRYPIIELLAGLVAVVIFFRFGNSISNFIFYLIVAEAFLLLIVYDALYFILPDKILLFLFEIIVIFEIIFFFEKGSDFHLLFRRAITGIVVTLFLGGIWFFTKGKGMGFGDVKLGFLIGILLGPIGSIVVMYSAVLLGTVVGLILLIKRKANLKTKLPFGTFLGIATIFYLVFQNLINNFLQTIYL